MYVQCKRASSLNQSLTGDFLLIIIVVTGGEELSKDKSRHVDLLHLVQHHRNTFSIIPHADCVILTGKKEHTHTHSCAAVLLSKTWFGIIWWCKAQGPCGSLKRSFQAVRQYTHTSMLTLIQVMALSLCLLSAAFTVRGIRNQLLQCRRTRRTCLLTIQTLQNKNNCLLT